MASAEGGLAVLVKYQLAALLGASKFDYSEEPLSQTEYPILLWLPGAAAQAIRPQLHMPLSITH